MSTESDADFILRLKAAIKDAAKIYEESWESDFDSLGGRHAINQREACQQAIANQKLPNEMIFILEELMWSSWNGMQRWAENK
jgi:hypothetical protein